MKGFTGSGLLIAALALVIAGATAGARTDRACPCTDYYLTQVAETLVVIDTVYTYDTDQQQGDYTQLCVIAPGGDDDLLLSTVYGFGDGPGGTGVYRIHMMDPAGRWVEKGDYLFLDMM
ncbi:hypothetical protein JW859_14255 [bacterium]|nr:hypothetical protein [bacterium]